MTAPATPAVTEVLTEELRARHHHIERAQSILSRTATLFDEFGGEALRSTHAGFAELARSLESDKRVMLVVVGEFSRGKSSLVNALLGIELLRYAKEATTAINTFVSALPAGRNQRYIRVHYIDQRAPLELEWTDPAVLERWSTELDAGHADVRREVDRIEIFMQHPLLDHGLVLIDTPGLESLVPHHEDITRRAIAEAHIALWVLGASQLGGNRSEWQFMSDTVSRNFSKFITVINMWDFVLDSRDAKDVGKSEDQLAQQALGVVRNNFHRFFHERSDDELARMTDADHLMGVSAMWALDSDPQKQARSGIARLSGRIAGMFSSGEALEQIYRKPVKQLSNIQQQLAKRLDDELQQLGADRSEAERGRELALLEQEIKRLELEMRTIGAESVVEHDRVARSMASDVEAELIVPLEELKADIELHLTPDYVAEQIDRNIKKIGLPPTLAKAFDQVSAQVEQRWEAQRQLLTESLEALRADYAQRMTRHVGKLNDTLGSLDLSLPTLNVALDIDLAPIQEHHARMATLEQAIADAEQELVLLEQRQHENASNDVRVGMAQEALARAEKALERLGPQPEPRMSSRREIYSRGGMYSSDRYHDVPVADDSNVQAWRAERADQQISLQDKAARVEAIMEEEFRKSGIRMTAKAAQQRQQLEVDKFNRKRAAEEMQHQQARVALVERTLKTLGAGTAGQLQQHIKYLRGHVSTSIRKLYADQMELLQKCVTEQFVEPLNDKRAQREAVQQLLQQGQQEVAKRQQTLLQAREQLAQLIHFTDDALHREG